MSTYSPIASQTLGSASSSITFSNIPQYYTDLIVICWTKAPSADVGLSMQFNGDTSSNYSYTQVAGSGSVAGTNRGTNQTYARFGNNIQTNGTYTRADIQNYSNNTTYKTLLSRSGSAASGGTVAFVNTWRSTSAITSLIIYPEGGGNFGADTTISIYGIASGSPKAIGGQVSTDGTYWYHTFISSGLFIPQQSITADVLVVAGGGPGGRGDEVGGGGGAGGLVYSASQSLTSINYPVSVGAGGALQSNGGNSQFGTLTVAVGGGKGGGGDGQDPNTGASGGSGGGGGRSGTPTAASGNGTSGQGNNGGTGYNGGTNGTRFCGGGGGAGAVGQNGTSSSGGNGGAGLSTYSSFGSATGTGQNISGTYWYAGGGGGGNFTSSSYGTGGNGGGGQGRTWSGANATSGTATTGGGGGGGNGYSSTPGNAPGTGGSGVVIIRYAV